MVVRISHVHVPGAVHGDSVRKIKRCVRASAVSKTIRPAASQCGHHAIRGNLADAVVISISHVHVSGAVHGNTKRRAEHCVRASAISESIRPAAASQRGHHAHWVHLADAIALINHVHVPSAVHGNTSGICERCVRASAISKVIRPAASQRGHVARRAYLADAFVGRISHVQVSSAVNGNTLRAVK